MLDDNNSLQSNKQQSLKKHHHNNSLRNTAELLNETQSERPHDISELTLGTDQQVVALRKRRQRLLQESSSQKLLINQPNNDSKESILLPSEGGQTDATKVPVRPFLNLNSTAKQIAIPKKKSITTPTTLT